MNRLIVICLFFSQITYAGCIKADIKSYLESIKVIDYFKVSSNNHTLVYSKDSCGIRGCELIVFTEIFPGCKKISFNQMGYPILNGLRGHSLTIKQNKEKKHFRYSQVYKKFLRVFSEK